MLSPVAAICFAVLAAAVVVFQVALAFGAPWGEFTLGGKYPGRLPPFVRLVPVVSGMMLAGFAVVVLAHAGLAFPEIRTISGGLVWVVVAYCAVGALANYLTPSRRERAVWFPIVVAMLGSSFVVAMN